MKYGLNELKKMLECGNRSAKRFAQNELKKLHRSENI